MNRRPHTDARSDLDPSADLSGRSGPSRRRLSRGARIAVVALGSLLALAVLVQLVASPLATWYVNRKLAGLEDYTGSVKTVQVKAWKLGVSLQDLVLYPRSGDKDPPLVRVKQASLRVAFAGLLRGRLGGQLTAQQPEIAIIKTKRYPKAKDAAKEAANKAEEIEAKLEPWREALQRAFPLELTKLEVNDAKLRFVDRTYSPVVDVALEHVHITGSGLSNEPSDQPLPAKLEMNGTTTGQGDLHLTVEANPLAKQPRFKTEFELKHLSLPACNSLLLAYANVDVTKGTFEIFIQAEAEGGAYHGYVKPFLKDADFKARENASLVKKVANAVASAAVSLLKNDEKDQVATKAPFSGNFSDHSVDVWSAVQNLLRNAFVQALREGFENNGNG